MPEAKKGLKSVLQMSRDEIRAAVSRTRLAFPDMRTHVTVKKIKAIDTVYEAHKNKDMVLVGDPNLSPDSRFVSTAYWHEKRGYTVESFFRKRIVVVAETPWVHELSHEVLFAAVRPDGDSPASEREAQSVAMPAPPTRDSLKIRTLAGSALDALDKKEYREAKDLVENIADIADVKGL